MSSTGDREAGPHRTGGLPGLVSRLAGLIERRFHRHSHTAERERHVGPSASREALDRAANEGMIDRSKD